MAREYEDPIVTVQEHNPLSDTVETHPAYAMIQVNRVHGSRHLYGSDFEHQCYMTISVSKAELHRGLSNDYSFPQAELIEVALSEAQWASFVSSPNAGSGVQCTLTHHLTDQGRALIPQIPAPPDRKGQFMGELGAHFAKTQAALLDLSHVIEGARLPIKTKDQMLGLVQRAIRGIDQDAGFVVDQFGEHMEQTAERAKIEVNAHVQQAITRVGLGALRQGAPFTLGAAEEPQKALKGLVVGGKVDDD